MADPGWGLGPAQVDAAFPFHLVLDTELRILHVGSSLRRLLRNLPDGPHLTDLFEVATPKGVVSFADLTSNPRALFLLQSVTEAGLLLRGQMLHDHAAGCVFFVGSPWVTETATFGSLGLTLDDFAVSDAVVDYVLLLQRQSSSLAEARELASRLHETADQLTHQAFHDALTGLANRAKLIDHLSRIPMTGQPPQVSVLMLDLDGFKAVNDSYGHAAGDEVLDIVGARLRGVARADDLVARLGGDEFALVLESVAPRAPLTEDAVTAVVERVLAALSDPIPLASCSAVSVRLSASIGIAYRHGTETADDLLRNADLAMYAAKAGGKSRYQHYIPAMHTRSMERMDLASELRVAVNGDQLRLAYQPILRLAGDRFAGAEALLRWQHPTRGLLGPDKIIELAEETGLIVEIGAWVLDEACRELRVWQAAHTGTRPLGVAVNISGRQFGPDLVATVATALQTHRIDPGCLTLEITEGLITGDGPGARDTLRALKRLGVWLAIDDFGTGHSSLGRLRDYDFDELKIDRMFVGDLDTGDPTLVATQIALARGLGLNVVAEGVETLAQLEYLRHSGCDQVQGFLVARPVPASDVRLLLAGQGRWRGPTTPRCVAETSGVRVS